MRLAAIGDLHARINSDERMQEILAGVEQDADVLLLAGDLTDTGKSEEMEVLLKVLSRLDMPIIAVLGNHDHECGMAKTMEKMIVQAGIHLLDGSIVKIDGVGFVGTKGFCGGFDKLSIQPFGEQALKTFIQTSLDEAVRLENAAAKLDCEHKIALLHYAPISETLKGEPPELWPFLGSGRLGNALDRQGIEVIFHGHAHHGSPEGITAGEIPVHNVSRFVQTRMTDQPYCLYEVGGNSHA